MVQPHRYSTRTSYYSRVIHCGLALIISMLFVWIAAYPHALNPGQKEEQAQQLVQGKPIERELAGGQSHTYQITLNAGQYVKLVVDQRGIDVSVSIFSPDGKPITEANSEPRTEG